MGSVAWVWHHESRRDWKHMRCESSVLICPGHTLSPLGTTAGLGLGRVITRWRVLDERQGWLRSRGSVSKHICSISGWEGKLVAPGGHRRALTACIVVGFCLVQLSAVATGR